MSMGTGFWVLLGVVAALLVLVVVLYNRLVILRNQVKNAWSQIDVQLKRRHDLIPNLVETARAYMAHERETLEGVTAARQAAAAAKGMSQVMQAETRLEGALAHLFALAENYPDLKANQNFLALHEELTTTENRITFARQAYNDAVMSLNNAIGTFPSSVVAGMFSFASEPFFTLGDAAERVAPRVNFR